MRVIIIDDETRVRNSIRTILQGEFPDFNIIASAATIKEGYDAISQGEPDLVFLDVELPDGTGFDLLESLMPVNFKVVFITGHQEYALRAIKISALDFILKPFAAEDICSAVKKARELLNKEEEQLKLLALKENLGGQKVPRRIVLSTAESLHIVSVSDIIRAEADSNYTVFLLADRTKIMVSRTIKEFDLLLSGAGLIRAHQSHLVNISYIDRFVKRDGGYLQLKDDTKIPVSHNLKKQVIAAINDFMYK